MKRFKKILIVNILFLIGLTLASCTNTQNNTDPVLPILEGLNNRTIEIGTEFDPLEGVKATWKGIDITIDINVEGSVDINTEGTYELTYTVESELGDLATKQIIITVEKKEDHIEPIDSNFTVIETNEQNVSNVNHIQASGNILNDAEVSTYQEVNVFKQGDNVLTVSWSKFNNGKYTLSNTLDIAKDFELNNPNYEVIAAVNGDFFWTETISANVMFGNRVIKPENDWQSFYQSVSFNKFGEKGSIHKSTSFSQKLHLSLYNEVNSLEYYDNNISFNKTILLDDESTVLFKNSNHTYDSNATYFILDQKNLHQVGAHSYFEAKLMNKATSINQNEVMFATKNNELSNLLKTSKTLIVQNVVNEIGYNDMLMGIDSPIIVDNNVLSFDDMTTYTTDQVSRNKGRHPRTGFGFDQNGSMVLITVDGRGTSKGVDLREFANIMKYYDVKEGYNLDGGGSTQAVLRVDGTLKYVNTPSENNRSVGNALLFVREKELKPNYTYKVLNNKVQLSVIDTANINKVDIMVNGVSNNFTNLSNITVDLDDREINSISVTYTKEGNEYNLFNDVILSKVAPIIPNKVTINSEQYDAITDYDFQANIGTLNKVVVFTKERWEELSTIVDSSSYDKQTAMYRMSNIFLAVTDKDGKVLVVRSFWKWTNDQHGYQITQNENGEIVIDKKAFDRNNLEVGLNELVPEGGYVFVFPTVTGEVPTQSVLFGTRNLLGLEWDLYLGLKLPGSSVSFEDWQNLPTNPFADDFKIEWSHMPKKEQYVVISNQEYEMAENFSFDTNISLETKVYRFDKAYLDSLNGFWQGEGTEDKDFEIKLAFVAITDNEGKVQLIRLSNAVQWTASQITFDGNNLIEQQWPYASEYMQTSYNDTESSIILRDLMPEDGYMYVFPNNASLQDDNPRTFAFKTMVNPNATNDASFPDLSYMVINPFQEGFIIDTK